MSRPRSGAAVAASVALLAAACRDDAGAPARVFAAASLTAPFEALARAFERANPGRELALHFAGTPQLVVQLREGAAASVFAAADEVNMQRVTALGTTIGPVRVFARNRLAIVVREGNPRGIAGLADLARAGCKVALCGPDVPAGRYARQSLAKANVVVHSLSDEPSVKSLVTKVRLGELDAGIVYATDVLTAGVAGVAVAPEHDVVASYPICVLGTGGDRERGEAFVQFVLSPAGQRLLAEHGFLPP
ncbi:MAG TPA: molybdate ABC transporter substrate-binding protein [Planctomycetota bacterium]|nr:molybdate ABC transporter substrate-binding protein [Planctomycetota bacterium]